MRPQRAWTVLLALLTWSIPLTMEQSTSSGNTTTLRLLLVAPFPDSMFNIPYTGGNSLIPSALMAIDEINSNPTILTDYHLEAIIGDGGCTITEKAVSRVLENVVHRSNDENIVGIVGPACSEATLALSALVKRYRIQLPLVTIANSPVLENMTNFPFTFGVVSTSSEHARTATELFKRLSKSGKWEEIALYYEGNRAYNLHIFRAVLENLISIGVNSTAIYRSPISPTYMPLEDIMERGIRVAFVFSSKGPACLLMCRAFHLGITYPAYQFVFTDRRLSQFQSCASNGEDLVFTYNSKQYRCSNDQIVEAIRGFVLFYFNLEALRLQSNTTRAVSGYTFSEYKQRYEQRLLEYSATIVEEEVNPSVWANPFYDAVWAVALAANQALPNLDLSSKLGIWDAEQINRTFNGLSFRGVSTTVDFNPNTGFSHSIIDISQIQYNVNITVSRLVGYHNSGILFDADDHNSSSDVLSVFIESSFEMSMETIPLWLSIPGYILTALVFAATLTYHGLHVYYRHRPSLKASSPKLNHLIFLGCYTLLGSVVLDTTNVAFPPEKRTHLLLCYIVTWLEHIGVAFVFSTLFVKYYRLYLVFLRTYDHRSNLTDNKLMLLAAVLVAIEVAILAIWAPFHPLEIDTTVERDDSTEIPTNREKRICVTTPDGKWFTVTASTYLAMLILAVVTLSILNRRIKQRDFNTTASTNVLVYMYTILLSILLPFVYIESNYDNIDLKYGLTNSLYLMFTILCLVFLFTPPLWLKDRRQNYSLTSSIQKISNILALGKVRSSSLVPI